MKRSIFKDNESKRSQAFKTNSDLDKILYTLIKVLKPVQQNVQQEFDSQLFPFGFVVGNPRSGTTLLLQWLSSLNQFSYPTNILNRFAYAPHIGALVQELLFNPNLDAQNEFSDLKSQINFSSELGKTEGALSANEFQHFFRNYMPNFDPEFLEKKDIDLVNFEGIKHGLSSIEYVFNKPFVLKAIMLQYNILELYKHIPKSIFIYIKRNPLYNMQSLYYARLKYYSDSNIWWSVKPQQYETLKGMDVYHQIAGQVYYTDQAIEKQLEKIPDSHKILVDYELFCKEPEKLYGEFKNIYSKHGIELDAIYTGAERFEAQEVLRLSKEESLRFEAAYKYFQTRHL